MKISIITVTYNCEKTLERTMDSVFKQKYSDLEYLIIDGCSSDGTLDIIKKYQSLYPNVIRFISEKDNGLYAAMNKGIRMATGEIIGIINGDDYYTDGALQAVVKLFRESKADIVYSDLIYTKDGKSNIENPLTGNHERLRERMSVNHPTCFVKRKVYERYGDFDIHFKIAADYELMARFYKKGCCFKKSEKTLAIMEMGGLSSNNWNSISEKYEIHRKYFGKASAEIYRLRNTILYFVRCLKNR